MLGVSVTGLNDVVAVVIVAVELLDPDSVLGVLGFEQLPYIPYMYPPNLPLSLCLQLMFSCHLCFLAKGC